MRGVTWMGGLRSDMGGVINSNLKNSVFRISYYLLKQKGF